MAGPNRYGTAVDVEQRYPPLIRRPWLALGVLLVVGSVMFLGGQAVLGIGAENRCNNSAQSARYQ